jgi:hypothetical protein
VRGRASAPTGGASQDLYPQSVRRQIAAASDFAAPRGVYFSLRHPHIASMAHWQKSNHTREPTRTKAELRQMLAEAVRNTQPSASHGPKRLPKAKKAAARAGYVD